MRPEPAPEDPRVLGHRTELRPVGGAVRRAVGGGTTATFRGATTCTDCGTTVALETGEFVVAAYVDLLRAQAAGTAKAWCDQCSTRRDTAEAAAEAAVRVRDLATRRLQRSGLPARWRDATWDRFTPRPGQEAAWAAIAAWVNDRASRPGVLLYGPPGRGKSYLAAMGLRWRLSHGPGRWLNLGELVLNLRMPFDSREFVTAMRALDHRGALVMDDFGKLKPTEHALQPLYVATNRWSEREQPLIVTVNTTLEQVATRFGGEFGEPIASRLAEHCHVVPVGGPDHRRPARKPSTAS